MKNITIESVDLVVERIGDDKFKVKLGDLTLYNTEFEMRIGDTMTINIASMLVYRRGDIAQMVEMD